MSIIDYLGRHEREFLIGAFMAGPILVLTSLNVGAYRGTSYFLKEMQEQELRERYDAKLWNGKPEERFAAIVLLPGFELACYANNRTTPLSK